MRRARHGQVYDRFTTENIVVIVRHQKTIVDLLEKLGPENARQWSDIYGKIQTILDNEQQERRSPAHRRSSVA